MKKIIYCIIALILCAVALTGCSGNSNIDYSDTYVAGQDSQENFINYYNEYYYASSGDNYYFVRNGFLYAIDKETRECYPLCNKSDCLHDREDSYELRKECKAYLNSTDDQVVYNDGFLYYCIDDEEYDKDGNHHMLERMCRLSVDGTKREIIYTTEDYTICNFRVHRGYLYMEAAKFAADEEDPNGEKSASLDKAELLRVASDGQDKAEVFLPYNEYRKKYKYFDIRETKFYGNHLFLRINYSKKGKSKSTIFNVDLETKELKDIGDNLPLAYDARLTIFNDKLVFNGDGTKIYECDFNGENLKEVLDGSKIVKEYNRFAPYSNDGKNLFISVYYVNPKNGYEFKLSKKLISCNKKYEYTVHEMPIKYRAEIGFDKDFFIFQKDKDEKTPLYLIDKNNFSMKKVYKFPD